MKESAIRERLVKRGEELVKALKGLKLSKPKDLSEAQYREAEKLVNDLEHHPHAFVTGCIMDLLISADRAWFIPYSLSRRIGNFDFCTLLELSEDEIRGHMKGPPALHLHSDKMGKRLHAAIQRIANKYQGNAGAI